MTMREPDGPLATGAAGADTSHAGARTRLGGAAGRWMIFAAAAFWGTSATLARYVFRDHHVSPFVVVELRLVFAIAVLAPWLAWRAPHKLRVAREDWAYMAVLGLAGIATVQGSYYYSISKLGVGLAILIQYLAPALVVLYDAIRGARVKAATLLALACAIGGTALLVGDVDAVALHARPLHWAVSFSSAFWFAAYILLSKHGLSKYAPETVILYAFSVAAIVWMIVTPPWRIVGAGYGPRLWAMFFALGMFSTLVPFALFNAGLRRLPASHSGILATLEPVVAVLSAAFFLGEGLRSLQWLGAMLVLAAAVLASRQVEHA